MWAQREKRGAVAYWVHVHADEPGETFDRRKAEAMARATARKWAAELGMTSGGSVSGGGEYGQQWRHSLCFMFKPGEDESERECEGHYDTDNALTSGAGIGEPVYCDGRCQG